MVASCALDRRESRAEFFSQKVRTFCKENIPSGRFCSIKHIIDALGRYSHRNIIAEILWAEDLCYKPGDLWSAKGRFLNAWTRVTHLGDLLPDAVIQYRNQPCELIQGRCWPHLRRPADRNRWDQFSERKENNTKDASIVSIMST